MTLELAKEKNINVDIKEFEKEFESHQRLPNRIGENV